MYRREHTRHRTDHKLHSAGAACRQHAAAGGQLGEIEKYGFTGTRYANRYNNVRLVKNMGPASPQPVSSRPRGASNTGTTIYAARWYTWLRPAGTCRGARYLRAISSSRSGTKWLSKWLEAHGVPRNAFWPTVVRAGGIVISLREVQSWLGLGLGLGLALGLRLRLR